MLATKNIPPGDQIRKILDLSRAKHALWLNLGAVPLLFLFGWLFTLMIRWLRSAYPLEPVKFNLLPIFSVWELVGLTLSIILMLVVHELIHGAFFWFFTRERPRFALKSGYAFAAAPDWLLPASQYLLVGLSPLVIITIVCILVGWMVPAALVPYTLLIATFNAAGALGDMLVIGWVLKQPRNVMVRDEGDRFTTYTPNVE